MMENGKTILNFWTRRSNHAVAKVYFVKNFIFFTFVIIEPETEGINICEKVFIIKKEKKKYGVVVMDTQD